MRRTLRRFVAPSIVAPRPLGMVSGYDPAPGAGGGGVMFYRDPCDFIGAAANGEQEAGR